MTSSSLRDEPPTTRQPRSRRFGRAALVVVAMAGSAAVSIHSAEASLPPTPSGWTQVFADDFNGPANTGVNTANWLYDLGTGYPGGAPNWGTGEIEVMTNSTQNVYLDGNGNLVIKPIRAANGTWTSGRIETQRTDFAARSGGKLRVEGRLQQPNVSGAAAAGYWPAFWMLGAAARGTGAVGWPGIGEIDIMEDINGRSSEFAALHCGVAPGGPCNEFTGIGSGERPCPGCQTGFHTYAMEQDRSVSPEQIRFYLDGNNFFTINANQVDATTWNNATHHGFFILLNVAMGGGFPAAFGGGPTAATQSGVPMIVDYVAVYTAGGGSPPPPPPPPPPPGGSALINANGPCLDVRSSGTANGTPVQIYTCNGTGAQQWTYVEAGSTLRALGKCLDIPGGATAQGTKLQIWDCNVTAAQVFIKRPDGSFYNPQSNRCLDVPGSSTTPGTQVQIWDCNGTNAQRWTLQS
jgi:beta-glucanase (GH16 family)